MDMFIMGVTIFLYLAAIAGLSYIGYRKTRNSSDYLLGGREMNPIVMALSYGATFISASAIVGFGGVAATFGMGIQWLCLLNILMGVIVAFIVFGRPTRRLGAQLGAHTFAQFLGNFYQSEHVRKFVAAVIFIGMPLYAAVVIKGGAVFIERLFDINLDVALFIFTFIVAIYVITGGIKGVLYTDAMQATIMFLCMLFLLFWFYHRMDMNFTEANRALSDISHLVPDRFKELGHQGWTAMPVSGSPQWYTLVTSLILGVGIGCLAQPQLAVRFMMVKSAKQLNRGVFIGSLFLIVTVGAIYHVGALSNLFFLKEHGMVASEAIKDMDKIIPLFINEAMPSWFGALFMLCILSASMSTLSAQFHTMGAAGGVDLVGASSKRFEKNSTLLVRIGIVVSIIVSYLVCYTLSAGIIAKGTALFMGVCATTFLPAYACALFWKGVTRQGAIASLWVGALSSLFAMLFLHKAEASSIGLCHALFGKDYLIEAYPWFLIDPILFSLPLSTATIFIVSRMTRKKEAA
ncbi:MAG: sodium:solute symporter family protein [Bacteroidales bacterium]|nr:sodium:solute symporter family protein [Bacteroidales bacterium]